MSTFAYELVRALKSKTIIILTAGVIVLSVFNAISSATNTPGPSNNITSLAYGYGSNGSYSMVVHLQNDFGQPLQNSKITIKLGDNQSLSGTTDANGYANFTVSGVNNTVIENTQNSSEWGLSFNYTDSQGYKFFWVMNMYHNNTDPYFFGISNSYKLQNGTVEYSNQTVPRYAMSQISVHNNPSKNALSILYKGNKSMGSQPVDLYVLPINGKNTSNGYSVGYNSNQITEKNMTYYGTYAGFSQMILNPGNLNGSNVNFYVFALFTPNGKLISSFGITTYSPETVSQVTNQFYGTQMSIMGLFIPLMAAVSAYATYGRDKTEGVLESVLARPISRKVLILSRYLATLSAVFASTFIAFAISSSVYDYYLGNTVTATTFLSGLWSLLVISAAYIGLVYLVSNLAKSGGVVLGFAIAIFIVFDFLWTFSGADLIPVMITSFGLHLSSGGIQQTRAFIDMYYLSPAGLPNITSLIITGTSYYTIYARSSEFTQFGLTWSNVILAGVLWITVPLALSVLALVKRG